jgi:hypothetical protein
MNIYFDENIGQFAKGVVVQTHEGLIGHVEGFALNSKNGVDVVVSLCTGESEQYHPHNLSLM